MRKRIVPIFFLILLCSLLHLAIFSKAYFCVVNSFDTDKNEYFYDDELNITASWQLDYNPLEEVSFIQVQIYDKLNVKVWNSSRYYDIGSYQDRWTVNISDLGLSFSNNSIIIYVKFFYYYFEIATMWTIQTYLETKAVKIYSSNLQNFTLNSDAGNPDTDGHFNLLWTSSVGARNYSIYTNDSQILEINNFTKKLSSGIEDLTYPISGLDDGVYYFMVIGFNKTDQLLSNCISVSVLVETDSNNSDDDAGNDVQLNISLGNYFLLYMIFGIAVFVLTIKKKI